MSAITNGSLQPTWYGHVTTARDALILFEACLNGTLHHVPRRPHDRERSQLIKSGCVFIYEENASGIKRWTDGVPWSPSRILGNFLVYRELMKPFPPGEKKRATKKQNRPNRATKPGEPYPRASSNGSPVSPTTPGQTPQDQSPEARESERALIGSLVDSYGFKEGGLVKKTMSVNVHGVHHHLVSYYTMEDALEGKLQPPTADPRLQSIEPRHDLVARQSFRAPLDENDDAYTDALPGHHSGYHYGANGYSRPDLLIHGSHPAPLGMGYSNMPLTSPAYSSGPPSYAAPPPASSFYHPPPPIKSEHYHPYNGPGYSNLQKPAPLSISTTERRSSAPTQSHYPYRHGPPTPHSALPSLGGMSQSDGRSSSDASSWDSRSAVTSSTNSSVYSSTTPSHPHSAGPYSTNHSQWNNSLGSPSHSLPRIEGNPWSSEHSNWSLDHPAAGRQASYAATPQHST